MSEGKLFVGQVPAVCTEAMLRPIFTPYGTLLEIKIMRDAASGRSKGCAWVRYGTQEEAQLAIDSLDGKHTIPPHSSCLQVRFAPSQGAGGGGGHHNHHQQNHHHGRGGGWAQHHQHQHHQQQQQIGMADMYGGYQQQGAYEADQAAWGAANQMLAGNSYGYPGTASYTGSGGYGGGDASGYAMGNGAHQSPSETLFIGNLPPDFPAENFEATVMELCTTGRCVPPVAIRPPQPGKRFGFAVWNSAQDAASALQTLTNQAIRRNTITVQFATPRRNTFQ